MLNQDICPKHNTDDWKKMVKNDPKLQYCNSQAAYQTSIINYVFGIILFILLLISGVAFQQILQGKTWFDLDNRLSFILIIMTITIFLINIIGIVVKKHNATIDYLLQTQKNPKIKHKIKYDIMEFCPKRSTEEWKEIAQYDSQRFKYCVKQELNKGDIIYFIITLLLWGSLLVIGIIVPNLIFPEGQNWISDPNNWFNENVLLWIVIILVIISLLGMVQSMLSMHNKTLEMKAAYKTNH